MGSGSRAGRGELRVSGWVIGVSWVQGNGGCKAVAVGGIVLSVLAGSEKVSAEVGERKQAEQVHVSWKTAAAPAAPDPSDAQGAAAAAATADCSEKAPASRPVAAQLAGAPQAALAAPATSARTRSDCA